MPAVRQLVERATGITPHSGLDPELCVALGAGMQVQAVLCRAPCLAVLHTDRLCRHGTLCQGCVLDDDGAHMLTCPLLLQLWSAMCS